MICVLGDAHVDVVVSIADDVAADADTPASTSLAVGGQGANVAAWVVALGGRSRLITARATDLAARLVTGELTGRGVEVVGPVIAGHTGVVVALSDHGAGRSMLTDRGVGPRIAPETVELSWLDGCSWLHLPGYSLTSEPVGTAALMLSAAARDLAIRLSVDLSSTSVLTEYGVHRFRDLLGRLGPDVVFGNKAETELIGDLGRLTVISKHGADGIVIGGRGYPAVGTEPADATGAGDAFAAGYLLGGVDLALRAAARAVATIGAMP